MKRALVTGDNGAMTAKTSPIGSGSDLSATQQDLSGLVARYAVVIPAYNEAATIREVASRALRYLTRVVVIDDGSTDGTAQALDGLPVTLLRNPTNLGKAASLWRGFNRAMEAGASAVISLDGDGQHAPEDIPRLVAAAEQTPDCLIIGARRRERHRPPTPHVIANRVANFWISWAAGYPIADSQSGFRIYPARLLRTVKISHGKAHSFVFESEILIEGSRLGHTALPVPIEALPSKSGRPSHFRPVVDILRITRMVAWKLISHGMHPAGLYRTLTGRHRIPDGGQ